MNKAELAAAVADKAGVGEVDARRCVDAVFETIMLQVAAGDRVQVLGFGTFDRVERAARVGRNPQTGAQIQVPAGTSPRFHAGQTFRSRVTDATEPASAPGADVTGEVSVAVEPEMKKAARSGTAEKKAKSAGKKDTPATAKTGPAKKAKSAAKTGPAKKAKTKAAEVGPAKTAKASPKKKAVKAGKGAKK